MLNQKAVMAFLSMVLILSSLHASSAEQIAKEGETAFYHQNFPEARKFFLHASEQGEPSSFYYLGIMNLHGYGTPLNYKEAVRLFTLGAQKNHSESQIALGVLLVQGVGIPQNFLKGSILFTKAAKQGNLDAQLILGWIYRNGIGVKADNTIAYALWNYVAAQGNNWARINRDAIIDQLSESELYRAQELSSNLPQLWKALAAQSPKTGRYLSKQRS